MWARLLLASLALSTVAAGATEQAASAPATVVEEPPPWSSPGAAGIDPGALHRLVEGARSSHASALVVVKDGRIVVDENFGTFDGPTETMSATKSVVSLAVGMLLDEGGLVSLDQPVADFYPEWRQGRRGLITLRHLLAHTSGLRKQGSDDPYDSDAVKLALASEPTVEPGTEWRYNNTAVNLLAGIVKKASGQRLDEYLRDRLFVPLGIASYRWWLDGAGNPLCMAGLELRPRDLAKIGEMLANGGLWRGRRIVSQSWIETAALQPSQRLEPDYGLLWWLVGGRVERGPLIDEEDLARLRGAGADPALVEKLSGLKGRAPQSERESAALIQEALGPDGVERWVREVKPHVAPRRIRRLDAATGFAARGALGQYLWVSPRDKLVVVCMHRATSDTPLFDEQKEFRDFLPLADGLVAARQR